ncbi:hypothetical protein BCIN_01g05880 [Botrytis cinerea B05.10]|uniref:Uncharacterized protein n=1 Tax=Botryotinia fuckeliana (strain B05.10) TaxID=332648 RepID=A0A384J5V5_BOTFB|nr:hypothetical protein BCIN_01g05880 [Botrytis cinerea B05.10]ATZ45889.1 hypothetical protein BCIN_01g05880 [Botrytis cinerea B05.10]
MTKQLFLLGTGFIGGTLLSELLPKRPDLSITALVRSDDNAAQLKALGVQPLKGRLEDGEIIAEAASKADIIVHAATADDLPSVRAVIKGIKERSNKSSKIIYIHTSGAGVISKDARISKCDLFTDLDPEGIDQRVSDSAPHRNVDLFIRDELANAHSERENNASVAILLPPIIYGLGTGPFNKFSISVPALYRATIKQGTGISVGEGSNQCDAVHVCDLANAYLRILEELEKTEPGSIGGPYWFAETEQFDLFSLSQCVSTALQSYGKSDGKVIKASDHDQDLLINAFADFFPPGLVDADVETKANAAAILWGAFGSDARSSADRLRGLGWCPAPGRLPILESVEKEEIPELIKQK